MDRPSLVQLYEVLGLPPGAPQDDVRQAWRRLAREHHPDRAGSQGAEAMARINHAYEVLCDPDRRAQHEAAAQSAVDRVPGRVVLPSDRQRLKRLAFGSGVLLLAAAGWAIGRWAWPGAPSPSMAQVEQPAATAEAPLKLVPTLRLESRPGTAR